MAFNNQNKIHLSRLTSVLFFLIFLLCAPSYAYAQRFFFSGTIMGTSLEVTMHAQDRETAQRGFSLVLSEFKRLNSSMSEWIPNTFVSRINENAGKGAVMVPEELFKIIYASIEISRLTGGAFDISWAAMRGLWNFQRGKERIPSKTEIAKVLPLIDYRNIELDPKKATVLLKKPGMAIGLGALGKGYAVDRAMTALAGIGINNALIRAGGDMRVQGLDNGKPWKIGIKDPRHKDEVLASLRLANISISTSGDYERYFIKDSVLYHHIIDPHTGQPARKSRSVTILAPDTMTSDALSTAVFILGPKTGLKLIESLRGVEAIIVDSNGIKHLSTGIDKLAP